MVDRLSARRAVVTVFLVWNAAAVFASTLPGTPSAFRTRVIAATRPYLDFTGLWQSWDMFAPHPQSSTAEVEALVTHADGQQTTWRIAGPEQVRVGKFRLDRWRKWRDAIRADVNWTVWPDAARFAARLSTDPSNPPLRVELVRRWGEVPPPRRGDWQPRKFPEAVNEVTYFSSDVRHLHVLQGHDPDE
jgi:hypothetical protein